MNDLAGDTFSAITSQEKKNEENHFYETHCKKNKQTWSHLRPITFLQKGSSRTFLSV